MAVGERPAAAAPAVHVSSDARRGFDILILDARSKQSLASVRSLGRAGLRVASGESANACEPPGDALAFHSRHSAHNVILPAIVGDGTEFGAAALEFVRRHPTRVVLPTCDEALMALMKWRKQLAELGCVLALAPDPALEITTDKDRTLAVAGGLGIEYPKTIQINGAADLAAAEADFGFPFVLKPTLSWTAQSADRLLPQEVVDEAEALEVTDKLLTAGSGILAQQWACGRREGVTLFVVDGEVLTSCAHVVYRTIPALGGVSVMRESIPVPPEIYSAAVRLVTTIGLQGVCEVEFRRDAHNRPLLMEINARLAGTIENAVRSGIDLPLMVWQWAAGLPVNRVSDYRTGVRTRWLQGDLRWLANNRRRVGRPDSVSGRQALWTFTSEFIRTHHYDCLDWRDLAPAAAEMRITTAVGRRSRN